MVSALTYPSKALSMSLTCSLSGVIHVVVCSLGQDITLTVPHLVQKREDDMRNQCFSDIMIQVPIYLFCDISSCDAQVLLLKQGISGDSVLSISFEVNGCTRQVGGRLLFERRRREPPRGVWGHAPPENFEI